MLVAGCGGSTSGTGGGGGAGGSGGSTGTSIPEPDVHRAEAVACTAVRPDGKIDPGSPPGECAADGDCVAGDNGRCVQDLGGDPFCSYDECQSDDDCGGGSVCECRNPEVFDANVCVHGNCKVDADCGEGGYCSPSAVTLSKYCTEGVPIGSVGYFCHTAADACSDDSDCEGTGTLPACLFDVDAMRFACFPTQCVN